LPNRVTAIETTGLVTAQRQLQLDAPLPITGPQHVHVIVLVDRGEEFSETERLCSAVRSPAFADLADPAEDIYTLDDGEPFDPKE